jgi:hypothetical protein
MNIMVIVITSFRSTEELINKIPQNWLENIMMSNYW